MISPGKGIYSINLNKTVSKGNYKDCILKYECFRTDKNLTQLNGAEVKVELIFE